MKYVLLNSALNNREIEYLIEEWRIIVTIYRGFWT